MRRIILLLAVLWGALAANPAQAKLVGLIYDDSSSMESRQWTAQYAAQVLMAFLNGERDRLWVVRMSKASEAFEVPLGSQKLASYLDSMNGDPWAAKAEQTDYGVVPLILDKMAAEAKPEDDVAIILLTDGEFNVHLSSAAEREKLLNLAKTKIKAKSVKFYLVAVNQASVDLQKIVAQGVTTQLLALFNGGPQDSQWLISDPSRLHEALADVGTRLVGGDYLRNDSLFTVNGREIIIRPPFPVMKVIVLVPGKAGDRNKLKSTSFDKQRSPPYEHLARMPHPDIFNPQSKFQSKLFHVRMQAALSPGEHHLFFSDPLPPETRVIFQTGLALDWTLHDRTGQQVTTQADGRLLIAEGEAYTIHSKVYDLTSGKRQGVPLASLPLANIEFTLQRTEGMKAVSERMSPDVQADFVTGNLRYASPGDSTAAVAMRYPGFLYLAARDLSVRVIRRNTNISAICALCPDGKVEVVYGLTPAFEPVARQDVTFDAPRDGTYRLRLGPIPKGVRVSLGGGRFLDADRPQIDVALGASARLPVTIERNRDFVSPVDQRVPISLIIHPQLPLLGQAEITTTLVPRRRPITMSLAGHSRAGKGGEPLTLPKTALGGGDGQFVRLEGLRDPLDMDAVAVQGDLALSYRTRKEPGANALMRISPLPPAGSACLGCFLDSGAHSFTVRYQTPFEEGDVKGNVILEDVNFWDRLRACWSLAALMLALIYAVWVAVRAWIIWRWRLFPATAVLLLEDEGNLPRRYPLRWGFRAYLPAFFPWPWHLPWQRSLQGGLSLRASHAGPVLLAANYPEQLWSEHHNESVVELMKRAGDGELPLRWGHKLALEAGASRTTYTLQDRNRPGS